MDCVQRVEVMWCVVDVGCVCRVRWPVEIGVGSVVAIYVDGLHDGQRRWATAETESSAVETALDRALAVDSPRHALSALAILLLSTSRHRQPSTARRHCTSLPASFPALYSPPSLRSLLLPLSPAVMGKKAVRRIKKPYRGGKPSPADLKAQKKAVFKRPFKPSASSSSTSSSSSRRPSSSASLPPPHRRPKTKAQRLEYQSAHPRRPSHPSAATKGDQRVGQKRKAGQADQKAEEERADDGEGGAEDRRGC